MQVVGANPEPINSNNDTHLCTCPHDNKKILILYKSDNPKELVCKVICYELTPMCIVGSKLILTLTLFYGYFKTRREIIMSAVRRIIHDQYKSAHAKVQFVNNL